MKYRYICLIFILAFVMLIPISNVYAEVDINDDYFSCYVIDADSGQVLKANRETEHHQIASMVKIMSLNIIFDAIKDGKISLDDEITISHNAAKQTGSELFIDEGENYRVSDLIKGVIVVSANDACVALCEEIANNEDNFVNLMNDKAKEWRLNDTLFANCTGLPTNREQYSSAKDVSIMMQHLISNKEYFDFSTIWCEEFTHPSGRITNLTNTNKLVKFYNGCDGGKTGYTDKAGFCLSATAKRENMRIISTIIGAKSSKYRFKMVSDTFNEIFNKYSVDTILSKDELIDNDIKVLNGNIKSIDIALCDDVKLLVCKDNPSKVTFDYDLPTSLKAPIHKGDVVGKCKVSISDGDSYYVDIVSKSEVGRATIFDHFKDIVRF